MEIDHVISELQKLFTHDTNGKLVAAAAGALITTFLQWRLKRKRLRAAIRMEVERTSQQFAKLFTPALRTDLEHALRKDPKYQIVILTSDRHVIIGNLTDDIAYMNSYMASRVLRFNDLSEVIDDCIHFMRSAEFETLAIDRKLRILAVPFDAQDEFQGIAMQLLEEL